MSTPIINVRLKEANLRATFKPLSVNILQTSTNTTLYYAVYARPWVEGATTWTSDPYAITEYNFNATACSGGILVASGYMPSKSSSPITINFDSIIPITSDRNGNRDIISICVMGVGGSVPTFASFEYKEVY